MRSKFGLLLIASAALAGCSYHASQGDLADRGVEPVNVPVVTRADYVFDAAAPGGSLAPAEKARLDAWFHGLDLGYGDSIYVDAPYADAARYEVAQVAGNYGMMVQPGAPVTAGTVAPGSVRVIVSRTRAEVPGCPNWSVPSQPNFNNRTMSNFGCGVNSNIAAMVANPEDLVHGREGTEVGNNQAATKAIMLYKSTPPTGSKGLQAVSPKGGN
ncbi:MAG TPA: CpaD family pilus assembly lipoprotein [Mycobacterium sp.]|uniref:CpaD family pilus assembly protein n=1 Tax=Mycobacterium sp. TaxID=1785 RepID=UPI002D22D036|nr:CpaD family pilus assembly lipoprotein [Mycobacterium sp.]HZU45828.1 CpaD family pilus assembly lipoprotein [Mycobacterium sp.]